MRASEEIEDVFRTIRDRGTMQRFLNEILTPAERRDLALRWRLMKLLHAGVPQRKVAARLGVSLCKITRGSRVLRRPGSVSRRLLDSMSKEEEKDAGTS